MGRKKAEGAEGAEGAEEEKLLIASSASPALFYAPCPMPHAQIHFSFGTKSESILSFHRCCIANKISYIAATNTSYTKI